MKFRLLDLLVSRHKYKNTEYEKKDIYENIRKDALIRLIKKVINK